MNAQSVHVAFGHHLYASHEAHDPVSEPVFSKVLNEKTREVHVLSRIVAGDYSEIGYQKDVDILRSYARSLAGKRLIFINATYEGGGVAIMRAPLIALLRSVGIDAHWYVLEPDERAFLVTKGKFHNVLQNVVGPGVELTDEDRRIYETWIHRNASLLADPIRSADVIVIDDWQPSGLIPYIKGTDDIPGLNPAAKIIFRDHIQTEGQLMSTPGTAQHKTWQYIWEHNQVSRADVFVTHPMDDFVPPDVPDDRVAFVPAASDPLDDLNRALSDVESHAGMTFINQQLAENQGQSPLGSRPYIALVARFDPSKGMPEAMQAYALARSQMIGAGVPLAKLPQLVIAGNGSADDPDGVPILNEIMRLREERYASIKDDIKVVRVPANDIAINALIRNGKFVIQPSTKEGFESRVTDAILQGKPVIGSKRGGIPLQIVDGRSGYTIDPNNSTLWASRMCELIMEEGHFAYMQSQAEKLAKDYNREYTTVPNALNWAHLSLTTLAQDHYPWRRRWVRDLRAKAPAEVGNTAAHGTRPNRVPQPHLQVG